jgi:hypothetical protein
MQSIIKIRWFRENTYFVSVSKNISRLALCLLVLGIFTDNHDLPISLDDFALFADRLNGSSDFHFSFLLAMLANFPKDFAIRLIFRKISCA